MPSLLAVRRAVARRQFALEMGGLLGVEPRAGALRGWRQRLRWLRLHEPPIVFLEPTGGVDPGSAPRVLAADRRLS